jgi:Shedu protein SduA, C-terminal
VFSELTGSPVVLLRERAYVGGKGIANTGGGVIDYLVQNALTDNVSLVEIKTPGAELCGGEYRSGTYPPGREVVGGVVQVLGYRDTFLHEIRNLRATTETFQAYNPRCYLLVGRVASLADDDAKKSFELFRTAQSAVQIITFDEVRGRLQGIRDVLAVDDAFEGRIAETGEAQEVVPDERIEEAEARALPLADLRRSERRTGGRGDRCARQSPRQVPPQRPAGAGARHRRGPARGLAARRLPARRAPRSHALARGLTPGASSARCPIADRRPRPPSRASARKPDAR